MPAFILILQTLLFCSLNLFAGESGTSSYVPERITYLPEYRMPQLFPVDAIGAAPWYDMNPFPDSAADLSRMKNILPSDYRQSRGEYLMGSFDEFLYFTIKFDIDMILDIEDQDRYNLAYLSRIPALYGTKMDLCLTGGSGDILPLITEEGKRKETVEKIQDLFSLYTLSGIDMDWEFPRNDNEKEQHLQLMKELKTMTEASGKTLSMAVSRYRLLDDDVYTVPDRINLMAYDFYGRHSTWEGTLEAVEYMMARYDIPPEKLLMGLPFYGRIFDGYSPDYWKKSQSYQEIVKDFSPSPEEDEAGGFYFNGPETVRRKMKIASDHALKGVFIWEIGQDIFTKASLSRIILDYRG